MSSPISSQPELRPTFPVLDTLRAVGALAVLTTHVAFQSGDYVRHGILGSLLSRLDVGVAIFFVLSGFLLARPYLARAALGLEAPSTGRYLWKRLLRIAPVYVVTVVIAMVTIEENRSLGPLEWLRSLTLTDVFFDPGLPQGLSQMWSLSVEVTFYLVLPLLMWAVVGRRRTPHLPRTVLVLGLCVALSCWWNLSLASDVATLTSGSPPLWLPAHLTWFVVGIALAAAHVQHQRGSTSSLLHGLIALGRMPGVCWSSALGLLVLVATPLGGPILLLVATPTQSLTKHLTYAVIAGLIVLTGITTEASSRYVKVMSRTWLRHLGHISFSIFCIHLVVLHFVRLALDHELFRGRGLELWLLTVGVTLLAAEALYRLIEQPALRLKNVRSKGAWGGHAAPVPPGRREVTGGEANSAAHTKTTQ